jgi:hypothetical protein
MIFSEDPLHVPSLTGRHMRRTTDRSHRQNRAPRWAAPICSGTASRKATIEIRSCAGLRWGFMSRVGVSGAGGDSRAHRLESPLLLLKKEEKDWQYTICLGMYHNIGRERHGMKGLDGMNRLVLFSDICESRCCTCSGRAQNRSEDAIVLDRASRIAQCNRGVCGHVYMSAA